MATPGLNEMAGWPVESLVSGQVPTASAAASTEHVGKASAQPGRLVLDRPSSLPAAAKNLIPSSSTTTGRIARLADHSLASRPSCSKCSLRADAADLKLEVVVVVDVVIAPNSAAAAAGAKLHSSSHSTELIRCSRYTVYNVAELHCLCLFSF